MLPKVEVGKKVDLVYLRRIKKSFLQLNSMLKISAFEMQHLFADAIIAFFKRIICVLKMERNAGEVSPGL